MKNDKLCEELVRPTDMELENPNLEIDGVDPETDRIATILVDCGFKIHQALGPGLLESVYEICLAHELEKRGLKVERQKEVPLTYDKVLLETGFRLDLLIEDRVVVEVKATESLMPVHRAQIHTYLKLSGKDLGFLINFNVRLFKKGIERVAMTRFFKMDR